MVERNQEKGGLVQHHFFKMKSGAGFTLAEMMVVVAIFGVLGTILLARYRTYDDTLLLTNLAHDVALSIRQAQVYSVSVRDEGQNFDVGYGIHFDLASPGVYQFFYDDTSVGRFTSGDTLLDVYTLGNGYTVNKICVLDSAGTDDCDPPYVGLFPAFSEFDVVFLRPNPEPLLVFDGSDRTGHVTGVSIYLRSPNGNERKVAVFTTGQISVDQ